MEVVKEDFTACIRVMQEAHLWNYSLPKKSDFKIVADFMDDSHCTHMHQWLEMDFNCNFAQNVGVQKCDKILKNDQILNFWIEYE